MFKLVLAERKLSNEEIDRVEELYKLDIPVPKKEIDSGLIHIGLVLFTSLTNNYVIALKDLDGLHPFYEKDGRIKKVWKEGKGGMCFGGRNKSNVSR